VGCYIWYSEEGPEQGHSLPRPLLTVPITVLLYNGPLLCGVNVAIKELKATISSFQKTVESWNLETTINTCHVNVFPPYYY